MTRVYVILVNWNGWQDTLECLESLFNSHDISFRAIVCDNGSWDGSLELIKAWAMGKQEAPDRSGPLAGFFTSPAVPKPIPFVSYDRREAEAGGEGGDELSPLILIDCKENLGFAGGNNVGLRYVLARKDFDYVWLLNNDTVVDPSALSRQVERMNENPKIGMCGSTLLFYEDPGRVQAFGGGNYCKWIGLPWHIGQLKRPDRQIDRAHSERWMNYVVGASLFISREFLDRVGLMGEDYFLFFEETDWAERSKKHFSLGYAPESVVYHKLGKSIGTSSDPRKKSLVCDFFALRNRLKFTRRYHPVALPTIYLGLCVAWLLRCLAGRWDLARMIVDIVCGREEKWTSRLFAKETCSGKGQAI